MKQNRSYTNGDEVIWAEHRFFYVGRSYIRDEGHVMCLVERETPQGAEVFYVRESLILHAERVGVVANT